MPVTPTTWEEEAGKLEVREQLVGGALSQKKMFEKDWGYSSVAEYLHSMSEVLGSSWSTEREKENRKRKEKGKEKGKEPELDWYLVKDTTESSLAIFTPWEQKRRQLSASQRGSSSEPRRTDILTLELCSGSMV